MNLASDVTEIHSWPQAVVYIFALLAFCFVLWVFFRD